MVYNTSHYRAHISNTCISFEISDRGILFIQTFPKKKLHLPIELHHIIHCPCMWLVKSTTAHVQYIVTMSCFPLLDMLF